MLLAAVVLATAVVSLLLLMGRSYHLLIAFTVAAGSLQAPLMSLSESSAFQYFDDVPAAVLVLGAFLQAISKAEKRNGKALLILAAFALVVAFGLARSPDVGVGVAQARQVLFPFALIFSGYVLRRQIQWDKVWHWVLLITCFTLVWVAVEELQQHPLVSPTWYYLQVVGGERIDLRQGLPPSYFADGVSGTTPVFRPGGPFMNPPVMGFLLGLGAFAAVTRLRGAVRITALVAIGAALYVSYARAGILIFLVVTLIYFIWIKVGKYAAVLVSIVLGSYVASTFLEQGNTASHSDGLISGLLAGLGSPLGLGFGTTGYQAALAGTETGAGSESLLGLYFAWLGWPAIVASALVIWKLLTLLRRLPRRQSLPVWLSFAFLLTIASSESASSIASTPVLWLMLGAVMTGDIPADHRRPIRNRRLARRGVGVVSH